jgi:hypothetical protein
LSLVGLDSQFEVPFGDAVRHSGHHVSAGLRESLDFSRKSINVPKWYLSLTIHLLPERLRGEFGFVFGEREQRSMNLALALIRRLYPRLPMRIRTVGPLLRKRWCACKARGSLTWQCVGSTDFDRPAYDGIKTPRKWACTVVD